MRDILTDKEVELLLTFADMDMKMRPTAEAMHYDRRTIWSMLEKIFQETGFNPREFWDLFAIMKELEKEDADGREDEVRSEQDRSDNG